LPGLLDRLSHQASPGARSGATPIPGRLLGPGRVTRPGCSPTGCCRVP